MADFDTAWEFTRTWEGVWSDSGNDSGHYFPRRGKPEYETGIQGFSWAKNFKERKCGTTFGVTPQMLFDYVPGWQYPYLPTKEKLQYMTEDEAKEIWRNVAWKWCGGDDINDQSIATLLFDFMVRSNGDCWNNCPQVVGLTLHQACYYPVTYVDLGTRSPKDVDKQRNQKVYPFNQVMIAKINAHPNPKVLFDKFKAKLTKHTARRKAALQYNNMQYNTMFAKGTIVEPKADNTLDWVLGGAAVWLGGKLFKWW